RGPASSHPGFIRMNPGDRTVVSYAGCPSEGAGGPARASVWRGMLQSQGRPLRLLISFAPADRTLKDRLVQHLQGLVRYAGITLWTSDWIPAGSDWRREIDQALEGADVALILLSADYLASDFLYNIEVPTLLHRRASGGLWIIPVLLRPCHWEPINWLHT